MLEIDGEIEPSLAMNLARYASLKTTVQDDIHYLIVLCGSAASGMPR